MIQSKNPAMEEIIKTFEEDSSSIVQSKIKEAKDAFISWKKTDFPARSKLFKKLAEYLRKNKTELGKLASLEMGKVLSVAEGEVDKCAFVCDFYADHAEEFLKIEKTNTDASESYVEFDPLGVILAVMPWNFPYWQVLRFAAPTLMAGNVGILKHASNVQMCAEAIEKAFTECGFPQGVFQNLIIGSDKVEGVIRNPHVAAVTLTGSEKAGSMVAKVAGEELKKTVLELGGSDPFIVFDDADLELAVKLAVVTRMQGNVGQSCISAKRFIVHKKVFDRFVSGVSETFKNLKVGDPLDSTVQVGPLATEQILKDVASQVDRSIALGAEVEVGGRIGATGYFYEPTVLTNVTREMPVMLEEVFGPVISVISFQTDEEAVEIANDTPYGLASSIFTKDMKRAEKLIPQIEAGSVFVNEQVKSDPRVPFGGIKKSGYGRELSHYGIREFVNIKNVWIK